MRAAFKIRIKHPFLLTLLGPGVLRHQDRKAPKVEAPKVGLPKGCIHRHPDGGFCAAEVDAKQNGFLCPTHDLVAFGRKSNFAPAKILPIGGHASEAAGVSRA